METKVLRLKPGQDLKKAIEEVATLGNISGFVASCAGSLTRVTIRMAGATPERQDVRTFEGSFEIVSLSGTLSKDGVHLHVAFSNREGEVLGGHLKNGSLVSTTAEVVLVIDDKEYYRKMDEETGFSELNIKE